MRIARFLLPALVLLAACRLESHPPPGVPADEAAIRSTIAAWLAKEQPWAGVLRSTVRQDRDLATAWVVTSPPPTEADGERVQLFVLRREPAGWSVVFQGVPAGARR